MSGRRHRTKAAAAAALLVVGMSSAAPSASALPKGGGIFVSGHSADSWAVSSPEFANPSGAQNIIRRAVSYVTGGDPSPRLLLVTDVHDPGDDFGIDPTWALAASGFSDYEIADDGSGGALDLGLVSFWDYDAVVVASDFGGWLRQSELDILISRRLELIEYANNGGGLVALAESGARLPPGDPGTTHDRFGFLPCLEAAPAALLESGVALTAEGSALGLTDEDVNGNVSYSVFSDTCGMDVVDYHSGEGAALSLATRGPVGLDGRVFTPQSLVVDVTIDPGYKTTRRPFELSIGVVNPNAVNVILASITNTLPALPSGFEFEYVSGSTTGATSSDPDVSGDVLTWPGPFLVPAGGGITMSFSARAPGAGGSYVNTASAEAAGSSWAIVGDEVTIPVRYGTGTYAYAALAEVRTGGVTSAAPALRAQLGAFEGFNVPGKTISFWATSNPFETGTFLCSAVTDSGGIAECGGQEELRQVVMTRGFRAEFAGDGLYDPSFAFGPLVSVLGTPVV